MLDSLRPYLRGPTIWAGIFAIVLVLGIDMFIVDVPGLVVAVVTVGAALMTSDRVARRRTELAMLDRDQQIAGALAAARTIAWQWDPATDRVVRTGSLAEWLGLPPDTRIDRLSDSIEWIHEDDREMVREHIRSHGEKVDGFQFEYRMVRADGEIIWVLTRAQVLSDGGRVRIHGTHTDVTDRKERENRLRLLESVVVHANDAVVILEATPTGETGRSVMYVNDAFCRMTGYARDEVVGRSLQFLRGPDSDPTTLERIRSALEVGTPLVVELLNYRKDRIAYWVELSLVPTPGADGRTAHWVIIQRDISDRKKAEEAVRESDRRFRHMANAVPAILWVADPDSRLTFVSQGWYEFTGQSTTEALGHDWLNVIPPEHRGEVHEKCVAAIRTREPFVLDYPLCRADGELRWVVDAGRPWFDADGHFLGYVGSIFDIHDMKMAQDELKTSEERYRQLFDANPHPTWVVDKATMRFLAANDSAVSKYGYSREEFLTMTVMDIRPPEDIPRLREALRREDFGPLPANVWKHLAKDGTEFDMEMTVHRVSLAGRPARLVMGIDVTDRLQLEEHLRHTQKTEAIGQLAGGIAHDFNNLLTGVLGNLGLVQLPPGDPNRVLLDTVEHAARRAADLTGQLLGYARRNQLLIAPIDLDAMFSEVTGLLRGAISPDIQIVVEPFAAFPPPAADAGLIAQVLVNLCLNARDAMPDGGRLTLSAGPREVGPSSTDRPGKLANGSYVRLSVADTGTGIPDDIRGRIFEPFFTTKGQGRGTGLGLSMVHGILAQHGGDIEVHTAPGQGTRFDLFLPSRQVRPVPERVAASPEPSPATPGTTADTDSRGTILLVDDEDMIRRLGRAVLERDGYHVLEAENGRVAVDLFREHHGRIELVVLDYAMPVLSGRDASRELARIAPVRVLLSTGYSATDITGLTGVVGLLSKPYNPAALSEAVRTAVRAAIPNGTESS